MKKNNWLKKHKEIVALIFVPLVMTALVGLFYVLPSAGKSPSYDFVYAQCDDYCYNSDINVNNEGLVEVRDRYSEYNNEPVLRPQEGMYRFYYYDIDADESTILSEADLANVEVDDIDKAPDNFRIERGGGAGGGIFFGGYDYDDYNTFYAINGGARKQLELRSSQYGSVEVVGWVLDDRR